MKPTKTRVRQVCAAARQRPEPVRLTRSGFCVAAPRRLTSGPVVRSAVCYVLLAPGGSEAVEGWNVETFADAVVTYLRGVAA